MTADPARARPDRRAFDAVSLDVGGVLVLPDQGIVAYMLERRGVVVDRSRFTEGHYRAMAEVDQSQSEPETFGDYSRAFLQAVGVSDEQLATGLEVMAEVLVPPLWHQRIPRALDAAQRLSAAGLPLALTSNSDGSIEETMGRHEIAQVGVGPGVAVTHITDSGSLGCHKPDPLVFLATATGLGVTPERICHVGDSRAYDADGAAAVGMVAVHVDPLGHCRGNHAHVVSLAEFADHVTTNGVSDSPRRDPSATKGVP